MQRVRQTDRHYGRKTIRQTDSQADRDREVVRPVCADRESDRQTGRLTDGQTGRQGDWQTGI